MVSHVPRTPAPGPIRTFGVTNLPAATGGTFPDTADGPLTVTGTTTEVWAAADTASGTLALSGAATEARSAADTGSATVSLSGSRVEARSASDSSSGAI